MRPPVLAISTVLILAQACAGAPIRRVGVELPGDPSWPRDGGRRIAYVGEIRSPENLGIERGWLERALRAIAGEDQNELLYRPFAVAVAGDGRLAVADPGRRAVNLYAPARRFSAKIHAGLQYPVAAAFAGETLIVADSEARSLRAFDAEGKPIALPFASPEGLERPTGLAVDPARQRLFVSDAPAHRIHVIPLAAGGGARSFGERGVEPGQFNYPTHLALDAEGRLHVSDALNFRIQVFDQELRPLRGFGRLGDTPGSFSKPKGLAVDRDGNTYVVEGLYDVIQVFGPDGNLLGILGGTGTEAGRLWLAAGLCIDPATERLYVADTFNARVQVLSLYAGALPGAPEGSPGEGASP